MVFNTYHDIRMHLDQEIEFDKKYGQGGALGLATYLRIGSNLEI